MADHNYYALAIDKDGDTKVITFPETLSIEPRIKLENEAKRYCKLNNWTFQRLQVVPGTQRQNGTLSKTIKSKRGRKLDWNY